MDNTKYQDLLDDLEGQRAVLQKECNDLKQILSRKGNHLTHVKDAITVLTELLKFDVDNIKQMSAETAEVIANRLDTKEDENNVSRTEYNEQNQSSITLNDGVEKILTREGKPLHADKLVEYLRELGRFTDKRSLNSGMLKDSKKRFVLLSGNVFDLRSRQPHTLFPEYSGGANVTNNLPTSNFILINVTRDAIKELNGREFAVSEIFDILKARFPSEVNESRRRSIGSTINNLMLKGELEKVRVGTFDKPALYREKQS
jgi:hypothetical protein